MHHNKLLDDSVLRSVAIAYTKLLSEEAPEHKGHDSDAEPADFQTPTAAKATEDDEEEAKKKSDAAKEGPAAAEAGPEVTGGEGEKAFKDEHDDNTEVAELPGEKPVKEEIGVAPGKYSSWKVLGQFQTPGGKIASITHTVKRARDKEQAARLAAKSAKKNGRDEYKPIRTTPHTVVKEGADNTIDEAYSAETARSMKSALRASERADKSGSPEHHEIAMYRHKKVMDRLIGRALNHPSNPYEEHRAAYTRHHDVVFADMVAKKAKNESVSGVKEDHRGPMGTDVPYKTGDEKHARTAPKVSIAAFAASSVAGESKKPEDHAAAYKAHKLAAHAAQESGDKYRAQMHHDEAGAHLAKSGGLVKDQVKESIDDLTEEMKNILNENIAGDSHAFHLSQSANRASAVAHSGPAVSTDTGKPAHMVAMHAHQNAAEHYRVYAHHAGDPTIRNAASIHHKFHTDMAQHHMLRDMEQDPDLQIKTSVAGEPRKPADHAAAHAAHKQVAAAYLAAGDKSRAQVHSNTAATHAAKSGGLVKDRVKESVEVTSEAITARREPISAVTFAAADTDKAAQTADALDMQHKAATTSATAHAASAAADLKPTANNQTAAVNAHIIAKNTNQDYLTHLLNTDHGHPDTDIIQHRVRHHDELSRPASTQAQINKESTTMADNKTIKTVADAYRKMVSEDLVKGSIIAYNHETDKREKTRFQTPNQHTKAFAALPADHTGNEHTKKAQESTASADRAWKDPARKWGKDDKHNYHVSGEEEQLKAANDHTTAAEHATHPGVKAYHTHMAAYHEGKMEHHTNRRYDYEN